MNNKPKITLYTEFLISVIVVGIIISIIINIGEF